MTFYLYCYYQFSLGIYDLIYIDGDHKLDSVYNDIKMSCNLLAKDGVIIVDDYKTKTLPEVRLGVIKR